MDSAVAPVAGGLPVQDPAGALPAPLPHRRLRGTTDGAGGQQGGLHPGTAAGWVPRLQGGSSRPPAADPAMSPSPRQASMRWEDHPADLQLKECWLAAPGREPVLLVQGGEARSTGVAVMEGPPSTRGRKVWRFRFTYAVPEGGRVPFSATLKCKAGLQVSVSNPPPHPQPVMPPCWSPALVVAAPGVLSPTPRLWHLAIALVPKEPGGYGRGLGSPPPHFTPMSTSAEQHHL